MSINALIDISSCNYFGKTKPHDPHKKSINDKVIYLKKIINDSSNIDTASVIDDLSNGYKENINNLDIIANNSIINDIRSFELLLAHFIIHYPHMEDIAQDALDKLRGMVNSGELTSKSIDNAKREVLVKLFAALVLEQKPSPASLGRAVLPLPTAEDMAQDPQKTWRGRDKSIRIVDEEGNERPETPLDLFHRVYAPWVGVITRANILHIDFSLYTALANWAQNPKNTIPDDILPDSRKHWGDAKLSAEEINIYNRINALRRRTR